ncbi:hypothetical protein L596_017684 [Steinernema carpocapsae]|uniref:Uncharacterized protein n=1 Tax=Steinernema carpocapsae TaxID=34508 RepID=A0A4V6XW36_STECR|nr:hypothetical protein L596_017684 [Steinernema carpocapsae]
MKRASQTVAAATDRQGIWRRRVFWKLRVEWRVFGAPKPKYYGLKSDFCLQCIFAGCGSILTKNGRCLAIFKTEIARSTANFVEFVVYNAFKLFLLYLQCFEHGNELRIREFESRRCNFDEV